MKYGLFTLAQVSNRWNWEEKGGIVVKYNKNRCKRGDGISYSGIGIRYLNSLQIKPIPLCQTELNKMEMLPITLFFTLRTHI